MSIGTKNSVSNDDWKNWVVLLGNSKVIAKDVCEVGEAIKLNFKGDNSNMFNVLS